MSRSAFAEKLYPFLSTLEKIFLVGFIIGAGLRITHTKGSDEILNVTMSGLAMISFLTGYKPPAVNLGTGFKPMLVTTVNKVLYMSIAICIIGLLFFFLHYEGYKEMLMIGSMSVGVTTVVSLVLITQLEASRDILQPGLLRGIPLGVAAVFVLYYFGLP